MKELSAKHKIFCDEYLKDFNGTRAAIAAGYKKETATVAASRLLILANIKAYLEEKGKELSKKRGISLEMILEGYKRVAFFDPRKFYDENGKPLNISKVDIDTAYALAGVESTEVLTDFGARINTSKIKMSDRIRALDSLCRVLGFNAPEKKAMTDTKGNDKQFMTDDQFDKLLKAINK